MTPHHRAAEVAHDLAALAESLDGLDDSLHASIGDLAGTLASLRILVQELAAQQAPPAKVLLEAPPWPDNAQMRGAASTATGPTSPIATTVFLRPRTEGSASSDGHDVHVLLDKRLPRYAWEISTRVDAAMLDALTFKVGGMVSFDGDWTAWPGGSTSKTVSATNAMERLVGQNTGARTPDGARWGAYATFPTPVASIPTGAAGVTATIGGAKAWVTNLGHTCHWEIARPIIADTWVQHSRRVDYPAGTLHHWIDGELVLALTGLPWPAGGANRVYISCMIGGSGPEFLPRTPTRTGTLAYRGFRLFDLS